MKRFAVIGCGAIADSFHVPGLRAVSGVHEEIVFVDPDAQRAQALADKHGQGSVATDHRDILDRVDAAIIASPHPTHVPIAIDLVEGGVPVLCEKPLGVNLDEVERLRALAADRGVPIAVNQTRRFIPATQEIHRLIGDGTIGAVRSVEIREGDKFDWPTATPSMFGLRSGAQGILLDIGAHVLDLLVWWLGPLDLRRYRDDSLGGSEAAAEVELSSDTASVRVKLSWLAKQPNSYRIEGEKGTISWGVYDLDEITLTVGGRDRRITTRGNAGGSAGLAPLVVQNFLDTIEGRGAPRASADDVIPSLRLIDACYRSRETFSMPWHTFDMDGNA